MAIEYELVLAGSTPVNQVAERAFPDPAERPTGTAPLLAAELDAEHGFAVTVAAGKNAYLSVVSDDGTFKWEPAEYASVTFELDNDADRDWAVANALTAVRRLLDTGPEDALLRYNSDLLLLTRFAGELVKHHREQWWDRYPAANQLIHG